MCYVDNITTLFNNYFNLFKANQQIRYSSFFCSTSSSLADKLQKETNIKKRQHGSAACVCVCFYMHVWCVCLRACVYQSNTDACDSWTGGRLVDMATLRGGIGMCCCCCCSCCRLPYFIHTTHTNTNGERTHVGKFPHAHTTLTHACITKFGPAPEETI